MKTKLFLMLAIILALVATSGAPTVATAADAEVPFKGTYMMHPKLVGVENGCNIQQLPGEGNATHLGLSTWYSDAIACPATLTQSGNLTLTAANGDQLYGGFAGSLAFSPDFSSVEFWGEYWITDGSGRFYGNTGTGIYRGMAQLAAGGGGEGIIFVEGTLMK